jgi:hypothetical protein
MACGKTLLDGFLSAFLDGFLSMWEDVAGEIFVHVGRRCWTDLCPFGKTLLDRFVSLWEAVAAVMALQSINETSKDFVPLTAICNLLTIN